MSSSFLATLFVVAGIVTVGNADMQDYLSAEEIRVAIEPVVTGSNEYDCKEIALSMIRYANPHEEIDPQSEQIEQRMRSSMRMAKDSALHTRELKYVRLFNACLKEMGEMILPTAQYLNFSNAIDTKAYPEYNNPIVQAYKANPRQNPMPDYMVDQITLFGLSQAIYEVEGIPAHRICKELARTMLRIANVDVDQPSPSQPGMQPRVHRIFELGMARAVWTRQLKYVDQFHKCLEEMEVKVPPMAFYSILNDDTTLIGPIKLPEGHSKKVGEFVKLDLDRFDDEVDVHSD